MAQAHVMLDLETFGKGNDAAIVAIGAVKFIPEHQFIGEKFYVVVNPRSSTLFGKMDADTVLWWMSKERTVARETMLATDMVDLPTALEGFTMWYGEDEKLPVWGNGAAFDNVVLKSAYAAANMEAPWSYKADRCYRTVKELKHDVKFGEVGVYHNALDDAVGQARHLMAIGRKMGIKFA